VIISSGCNSRGGGLDPGDRFSSLGDETFIYTAIAAAIFVHSIPSGNRGIGMSLFERKGQLVLLFGSYSRKSKKIGCVGAKHKGGVDSSDIIKANSRATSPSTKGSKKTKEPNII
jgi:hypothetical protein